MYGDIIYDGCSKTVGGALQVHQNNSLRTVLNIDRLYFATALDEQTCVNWLDVTRKQRCCIKTFKALHGLVPTICDMFRKPDNDYSLRSSNPLNFFPRCNCTTFANNNYILCSYGYRSKLPTQ